MKKTQLSSVVFMWITFALGIVGILMMFVPCLYINAVPTAASSIFFPVGTRGGAWPSFIGYLLIGLGSLLTAFVALPFFQPSRGLEMKLLFTATGLIFVGAILVMLLKVFYAAANSWSTYPLYTLLAGPYITMGLSVFAIASNIYAIKLDW